MLTGSYESIAALRDRQQSAESSVVLRIQPTHSLPKIARAMTKR